MGALISLNLSQQKPAVTDGDLQLLAAIQQKRAEGKALTEKDRAALGRISETLVDALEIPGNGALRNILKRFLANGEISPAEQANLREALGEIPDIKENPKLTAHLKELRAKGSATDAEIDMIPKLAGKMSLAEDDAIYATLASLYIGKGISEPAAKKLQGWMDRQRIDREKFTNKQGAFATFKRLGLMGLSMAGLIGLFVAFPVTGLGMLAAGAITGGSALGAMWGSVKVSQHTFDATARERILGYGVNE